MAVLSAQSLTMDFGGRTVLNNCSFDIQAKDKIGLIGRNGAGKTTLLRLLTGELTPSKGNIFMSSSLKCGFVEQHACRDETKTAKEEMLGVFEPLMRLEKQIEECAAKIGASDREVGLIHEQLSALTEKFNSGGGLTYRSRTDSMLAGLGFTEAEQSLSVGELSGGQRTKLALGKLLLSQADLILLDEPTNHLDIKSVEWLEDFLSKFTRAAVIISHDRYFLDKVTNKTMEIERGSLTLRNGNYSVFSALKEQQRLTERRVFEQQKKEIKRIEGIIEQQKRFNRERNYITIASKQKQIDRIKENMTELAAEERDIKLSFGVHSQSGNEVIIAESLSKAYADKRLFSDLSFKVFKGERVFLLGANGCGKSTLLKTIIGQVLPDAGLCRFGANVRLGYFEQIQRSVASEQTLIDFVYSKFPSHTISELRAYLGAFNFSGEDVLKHMNELSGGERARASLLELMLRRANLLILDEPTNHLDISSREALERALLDYDGTVFCVSHDRFLVNRLATRIFVLEDAKLTSFDGSYDDYAQYLAAMPAKKREAKEKKPNEYKLRKERESAERKKNTLLKRLEEEIAEAERERDETERLISSTDAASDYQRLTELSLKLEQLGEAIDALYEKWLELNG